MYGKFIKLKKIPREGKREVKVEEGRKIFRIEILFIIYIATDCDGTFIICVTGWTKKR